jgi:hypothetical protein
MSSDHPDYTTFIGTAGHLEGLLGDEFPQYQPLLVVPGWEIEFSVGMGVAVDNAYQHALTRLLGRVVRLVFGGAELRTALVDVGLLREKENITPPSSPPRSNRHSSGYHSDEDPPSHAPLRM